SERTDFFGNPLGDRTPSIGVHNPYAVTFVSNGGSEVAMKFADMGGTITEPTAPTKPEMKFGGWYRDAELTDVWNFATDTVTSDIVLYAKWLGDEESALEKDQLSVEAPKGARMNQTTVTATVYDEVTEQLIDVTVSKDASWELYSDKDCKQIITG
ncbi:InlB B-repeat-containing protein, partial [Enterobacter quasiroggenkampii]|nr:InlB B-repeat-containing protein [Enterobacter quasiroggenkampii]